MVQSHLLKQNSISMNNGRCFCYISFNLNKPRIVSSEHFAFINVTSLHKTGMFLFVVIVIWLNISKWENVYEDKKFENNLKFLDKWLPIVFLFTLSIDSQWLQRRQGILVSSKNTKAAGKVWKKCNCFWITIEMCNLILVCWQNLLITVLMSPLPARMLQVLPQ